jgi:tRNA(Ile)-lysidine synthase TilS/MesJ
VPEFNLKACPGCFLRLYERRLRRILEKHSMLEGVRRIAVALSGGKDSTALLLALQRLSWVMGFEVVVLHFHLDMGEYSERNLDQIRQLTDQLGIPLHLVRIGDLGLRVERVKGWTPCAVCGAIKRALFNREARKAGAQALATAHTLEDALLFTFKNLLSRHYSFPQPVLPAQQGLIKKVKPLMFTPERLNTIYCQERGVMYFEEKCPFWSPRAHRLKEVFEHFEKIVPSGKLQLLLSLQEALPSRPDECWERLYTCEVCGETSTQPICTICRLRRWYSEDG